MSARWVPIEELSKEPYISVLCYPTPDLEEALRRIQELKRLKIDFIVFEGRSQIGSLNVLGKGCVSIVVKAIAGDQLYALKIRRLDANRESMLREARLQSMANEVNVGPILKACSENFLVMDFVNGIAFTEWIRGLKGRGSVRRLREVLRDLLDQCRRLDSIGLDHGELSNLS
ncbi:MAG: serine/threonine protein kinase, partial [Nitrososphaerota archaeon]